MVCLPCCHRRSRGDSGEGERNRCRWSRNTILSLINASVIKSFYQSFSSPSTTMSTFDFSQWPPTLTDIQLESLTHHATTYALAHGLTYLPPAPSQPPSPSSAIHAPISLLPAPVPRDLFQKAQRLQSVYNILYARVAVDVGFLDRVMGAEVGVGQADEFVRRLWHGWKEIREEGIVQVMTRCVVFESRAAQRRYLAFASGSLSLRLSPPYWHRPCAQS